MLLRIALIVAIIAGLGATAVSHFQVDTKIKTITGELADTTQQRDTAQANERTAKKKADDTKKELDKTNKELAAKTSSLETMTAEAAQQRQRGNTLATKLEDASRERNEAQTKLAAWDATGLNVDQVSNVVYSLKQVTTERDAFQEENTVLLRDNRQLDARLKKYEMPGAKVVLPPTLKGKVMAVDAKWEFVVLDIGTDQGAVEDGEMLVSRGGKLVAKVKLTSVQRNRSIANIIPEWKQGEINTGDQVISSL